MLQYCDVISSIGYGGYQCYSCCIGVDNDYFFVGIVKFFWLELWVYDIIFEIFFIFKFDDMFVVILVVIGVYYQEMICKMNVFFGVGVFGCDFLLCQV